MTPAQADTLIAGVWQIAVELRFIDITLVSIAVVLIGIGIVLALRKK